jgi:hypothetical protein
MSQAVTFVECIWHDAHSDTNSWITLEEIDEEPCVVVTCGILLPAAKEGHVVIAQSSNSFGALDSVLAVPVAMVQSLRVISEGTPYPSAAV